MRTLLKSCLLRYLPERLLIPLKMRHYAHALASFSGADEADAKVVGHIVGSGDHAVDIGANIGWYTKILSGLVGSRGKVFSFEPVPQTFALLAHCVCKLSLDNVEIFNCGLSESAGRALMEVPADDHGNSNFYRSRIVTNAAGPSRHYNVSLRTLDSFFAGGGKTVKFIKCDVEGHELAVLKGALAVIEKSKPAWLIEVSGDPGEKESNGRKLFDLMGSKGYAAYWFDGEVLRKHSGKGHSVNYFFLLPDHIAGMKKKGLTVC